jgi:hypothetical protein
MSILPDSVGEVILALELLELAAASQVMLVYRAINVIILTILVDYN